MPGDEPRLDGAITEKLIESLLGNLAANQGLLAEMVQQQKSVATSLAQYSETLRQVNERISYIYTIPSETKKTLQERLVAISSLLDEIYETQSSEKFVYMEAKRAVMEELTRIKDVINAHTTAGFSDQTTSLQTLESRLVKTIVLKLTFLGGSLITLLGLFVMIVEWLSRLGHTIPIK